MAAPSMPRQKRKPRASSAGSGFITPDVFESAKRQGFTGWFWLPRLTPSDQLHQEGRRILLEKSDWLFNNVGAVKMAMVGLSLDEVCGGLWPKWISSDPSARGPNGFNKRLTDAYYYANRDPRIFSADGQSDDCTAQFLIRLMIRRYGDCFGQFLRPGESNDGFGSLNPSLSLLPGYIVDNARKDSENNGWRDGVKRNRLGRPIAYRVLNEERGDTGEIVDAQDLLHFHDPFLPGQVRGIPTLASVAKKLFRREDIEQAMSNGTLARELVGYAIEVKEEGAGGPAWQPPGSNGVEERQNEDGSKLTIHRFFGDLGKGVQVPELTNASLKTIETNRPGTEARQFLDEILREVAWNEGYPPEYVYYVAGMGQGTAVRLVNWKVRNVINAKRWFQLIPQFLNRWPIFWAWQRIKNGNFGPIPDDWWKYKLVMPPDLSVDIGREGKLYDDRVATNKMSIPTYFGLFGEDDDDVEDINLAIVERRHDKLKAMNDRLVLKGFAPRTYDQTWPLTAQTITEQDRKDKTEPKPNDSSPD